MVRAHSQLLVSIQRQHLREFGEFFVSESQSASVTQPSQVSITPINSASSVETVKMPMNAPLMSQEGNMFFPGTQCLKVSIPSHKQATKVCLPRILPCIRICRADVTEINCSFGNM